MAVADGRASGRCLCGEISYVVRGPLRDVLICHCNDCRRWHGHTAAMTSARRGDVIVNAPDSVRWFTVAGDGPRPRRGFCPTCGTSLFWDAPERPTIGITAGTLDQPTGLQSAGHVYVAQAADYELLVDDGLPHRAGAASPDAVSAPPS
ncbi:MAG: GFA family protein [Nocardioidaceae bacterium]|nr:GFA family protein [Nocardioidaceae bacterium]